MIEMTMVGDFGKDLDDENALLYAVQAEAVGEVNLRGVVANLDPSIERGRLARGMLNVLGRYHTEVAYGTSCNVQDAPQAYEYDVPYLAPRRELVRCYGIDLLARNLDNSRPQSHTLVLNSGLTDTAELIDKYPALVRSKVANVAIMGGVEAAGNQVILDHRGRMIPDTAANNMFDKPAADFVYDWLQAADVPLTIVSKEAAYACRFNFSFYDDLAATGNPIGLSIRGRQKPALEKLWREANAPAGSELRGRLPERCDRQWFIHTFLDGNNPRNNAEIWPDASQVGKFQLYDSLNVAAVVHPEYFDPAAVLVGNAMHHVIGVSQVRNGIKHEAALRRHIEGYELKALQLG